MPLFVVLRKWPRQIAVVNRDEALECQLTRAATDVFDTYTPRFDVIAAGVRRSGIWLLDLTGTPAQRQLSWEEIGGRIVADVRSQAPGLDIAVGLSRSRLIARLLAQRSLPSGVATCDPEDEEVVLDATDLAEIPGLSAASRQKAHACGLRQVRHVRGLQRGALVRRFGRIDGERLYALGLGTDVETGGSESALVRKKLDAETMLHRDINDGQLLLACLRYTVDKLCHELRRQQLLARAITLVLRYTDNRSNQSSQPLARSSADFATLFTAASRLYQATYRRRVAIKSMRIAVTRTDSGAGQIDLFEQAIQRKQGALGAAITAIRERQGFSAVLSAANIPRA
jgi:DNA polymerase-4